MGDVVDTLFGGGQARGYRDLGAQLQRGVGALQTGERGAEEAYAPYLEAGRGALGQYQQALAQGQDPGALYSQLMSGYQESPLAKFQTEQATRAASRGAAAAGMLGSGAHQSALENLASQISSRDMQNYLNTLLGIRGQTLGGLGGLAQTGFGAAGGVGGLRSGLGQQLAGQYGQLGQAQMGGDISRAGGISRLLGTLGTAALL